jgi:hypothetical protein
MPYFKFRHLRKFGNLKCGVGVPLDFGAGFVGEPENGSRGSVRGFEYDLVFHQGKGLQAGLYSFLIAKDIDQVDLAVFVFELIDVLEDKLLVPVLDDVR